MSPNWVTLLSCRSKGGILPYPRFPALTFVGWSGQWYGRPILTKVVKWQNLGERAAFVMREWIEPCPTPFPCRDLRWAPAHAQWPQDKRVIKYARHLAAEFFFCKLDKVSWVATEKRNEPRGHLCEPLPLWKERMMNFPEWTWEDQSQNIVWCTGLQFPGNDKKAFMSIFDLLTELKVFFTSVFKTAHFSLDSSSRRIWFMSSSEPPSVATP